MDTDALLRRSKSLIAHRALHAAALHRHRHPHLSNSVLFNLNPQIVSTIINLTLLPSITHFYLRQQGSPKPFPLPISSHEAAVYYSRTTHTSIVVSVPLRHSQSIVAALCHAYHSLRDTAPSLLLVSVLYFVSQVRFNGPVKS